MIRAAWLALLLTACSAPIERVILLPDADGHVGVIDVQSAAGNTQLTEAYSGSRVQGKEAIVEKIGNAEVNRRYGSVIAGLPQKPRSYTLNFELGTSRLTAISQALMPGIQKDLKAFPAPEVVVTGHTDDTGGIALNDKLSVDRANRVADLLVAAGIPREQILIVGRGSRESLVVPAKPKSPEPRNRRVEIKLR